MICIEYLNSDFLHKIKFPFYTDITEIDKTSKTLLPKLEVYQSKTGKNRRLAKC